ncbi:hypothetical protein D3C78_1960310 [compost metagenome]
MGIVDHQPGATRPRHCGQGRQIGAVAVHAEHAIGDHQGVAGGLGQAAGQALRVVVQVAAEPRAAEQPAVE